MERWERENQLRDPIAIAIACQSFLSWLNLECYIPWSVFGDAIAIAIAIA